MRYGSSCALTPALAGLACQSAHDQSSRHLMKRPDGRAVLRDPYGPPRCVSRVRHHVSTQTVGICRIQDSSIVTPGSDRAHRDSRVPAPRRSERGARRSILRRRDRARTCSGSGRIRRCRHRGTGPRRVRRRPRRTRIDRPQRVHRTIPETPDPRTRYRRALHLGTALRNLWASRSITLSLAWRDLRASYSQEVLGFAWALIGPIMLMIVLTFLKGVSNTTINTHGIAYPLFLYIGLLPWTFFTGSVSSSGPPGRRPAAQQGVRAA